MNVEDFSFFSFLSLFFYFFYFYFSRTKIKGEDIDIGFWIFLWKRKGDQDFSSKTNLMRDGGDFMVCGEDFGEIGRKQRFRERI